MKQKSNFLGFNLVKISLCVLSLNCVKVSLWANTTDSLFKSDEIINMELRTDFSAIQNERTGSAVYHDGELIYNGTDGKTIKLSVRVILRGHFRRDTANCNFPPLYLNFNKNEVKNTIFNNQNKLKLVTPCQYEKHVIDEYLIYKMYNQVTDLSMKVRLVKILYYDTSKGKKLFEKYSFFLEDKDDAAERNNVMVKNAVVSAFDLDRENFKRMSVFQYIIGNDDWYLKLGQNIVIFQPKDTIKAPLAVPYDFDLSDFVNANYALSRPSGRIYKGLCYSADEFEDVFDYYRGLRPVFESIIDNMEIISNGSKRQMIKCIEYFYTVIESNKLIKQEFMDKCETTIDYKINME